MAALTLATPTVVTRTVLPVYQPCQAVVSRLPTHYRSAGVRVYNPLKPQWKLQLAWALQLGLCAFLVRYLVITPMMGAPALLLLVTPTPNPTPTPTPTPNPTPTLTPTPLRSSSSSLPSRPTGYTSRRVGWTNSSMHTSSRPSSSRHAPIPNSLYLPHYN